jgi:hypothetical protein
MPYGSRMRQRYKRRAAPGTGQSVVGPFFEKRTIATIKLTGWHVGLVSDDEPELECVDVSTLRGGPCISRSIVRHASDLVTRTT